MFYALVWLVVVALVGLWSLAAWSLETVGSWAVSSTGTFVAGVASAESALPAWLTSWLPDGVSVAIASMASTFSPILVGLSGQVGMLTEGWSLLVLALWAIGSLVLVGGGVIVHAFALKLRRRRLSTTRRRPLWMPA